MFSVSGNGMRVYEGPYTLMLPSVCAFASALSGLYGPAHMYFIYGRAGKASKAAAHVSWSF